MFLFSVGEGGKLPEEAVQPARSLEDGGRGQRMVRVERRCNKEGREGWPSVISYLGSDGVDVLGG